MRASRNRQTGAPLYKSPLQQSMAEIRATNCMYRRSTAGDTSAVTQEDEEEEEEEGKAPACRRARAVDEERRRRRVCGGRGDEGAAGKLAGRMDERASELDKV